MQQGFRKEATPGTPVWVEKSLLPYFFGPLRDMMAGVTFYVGATEASLLPEGFGGVPGAEAAAVTPERIGRVATELDILLESWDEMRSDARAGTLTYGELESRRADLLAQTAQRVLAP